MLDMKDNFSLVSFRGGVKQIFYSLVCYYGTEPG